jgi:hypothetical protein
MCNHTSADPIHTPKRQSFSPFLSLAIRALRAPRLKLAKPESGNLVSKALLQP